jgi:hypothetical protein
MAITPQRRSTVIHGHYITEEVNSNTWPLHHRGGQQYYMAITPQRRSTAIHGHYTTEVVNINTM